jgi:hypothetical protein
VFDIIAEGNRFTSSDEIYVCHVESFSSVGKP